MRGYYFVINKTTTSLSLEVMVIERMLVPLVKNITPPCPPPCALNEDDQPRVLELIRIKGLDIRGACRGFEAIGILIEFLTRCGLSHDRDIIPIADGLSGRIKILTDLRHRGGQRLQRG